VKRIVRVVLLFSLLNVSLSAQMYRVHYLIELKKDKTEKILVKYGFVTKLLKFRWTLYSNNRLVLFRSYDEEVAQYIMSKNINQDAIRLYLTNKAIGYDVLPYIILKFKKFDYITRKAVFDLLLFDKTKMISLKFLSKETPSI
jgi:hypothetical protein